MATTAAAALPRHLRLVFTASSLAHRHHIPLIRLSTPPSLPRLLSSAKRPLSAVSIQVKGPLLGAESGLPLLDNEEEEFEMDQKSDSQADVVEENGGRSPSSVLLPSAVPPPKLSPKEKKELSSYAHGLGKKLKIQQVGKAGVTPSTVSSFVDNLEANELLKIKVHANCPTEFVDTVKLLEEATGSVAVGQIGRSVILYRPSISKMKKKQEQGERDKKIWKHKPQSPDSPLTSSGYTRTSRGKITRSSTRSPATSSRRTRIRKGHLAKSSTSSPRSR